MRMQAGQDDVKIRSQARFSLPRLTPLRAASLLAGAVAVQALPALLPNWMAIGFGLIALLLLFVRGQDRAPIWFVLGFAWTMLRADAVLEARLPDQFHGRDIDVTGVVRGLPEVVAGSTRFELDVTSASLAGQAIPLQGRVRLNWYASAPELAPCSRWKLTLRLRTPRGFVNPGGQDGERGAAQHGIVAFGYVRDANDNQPMGEAQTFCVDRWRQSIGYAIGEQLGSGSASGLLRALAVGDQQSIADPDWQVLRATGIGHLISISGLHVGMFAAFGALLARLFWKSFPSVTLRLPGPLLEAPVALACALGYGLLAGMGVPTLRTLLMIAVALLARYARRASSVPQALGLAAFAIVIWDPLAVLSAGFWLSFVGVAILLSMTTPAGVERIVWREMPRIQILLGLALLPMTVWFFGQGSLVGPLANLIAVPWISFVVVPVTVAGSLLVVDVPALGGPLLHLADGLLMPLWHVMQWMAALPSAQVHFAVAAPWAFTLASLGILWCLLPRGVPARALGMLLVLPLLIPTRQPMAEGEFEIWMFDVGQGLSVLVRTRNHSLLYDAGPRYPSGFDIGDAVVVPSLHALGVDALDRMIISHGDSDHSGGALALHLAFPGARIDSGEPERLAMPANACVFGETWNWDGVSLRVVSAPNDDSLKSNDRSCVVLVSGSHGSLLLTGDATSIVEPAVVSALGELQRPLILTVPHHGSKTGSSAAFLDAISPQLGLVSAGYRNHFGHPHEDVRARYAARSIPLLGTAESGYLHLRLAADGTTTLRGRQLRSAWWRMP